MNKFTKKIAEKYGIFVPVALVVLVLGIVLTAIFGWNIAPAYDSGVTVKISVNSYYTDERVDALQGICKKEFSLSNISPDYVKTERRTTANNYAVVYSFGGGETKTFDAACEKIRVNIKEAAAESDSALNGLEDFVFVSYEVKTAQTTRSSHFILRACIAGGVLLIATFIYVSLRYKIAAGITATAIALVTLGLTASVAVIARIPVSSTCANALFLSLLLGAIFGVVAAGKMHAAEKDEENAELSSAELVVKGMPEKTLIVLSAAIALGILLIGAMGTAPVQWLSLITFIGLACALFTAGILFPAIYPPVLTKLRVARAARRRYDYNKKAKATKQPKAAVKDEIESVAEESKNGER